MPVKSPVIKTDKKKLSAWTNRNIINYLLVGVLVVGAFVIGSLYQKVQFLEGKSTVQPQQGDTAAAQVQQPVQAANIELADSDPTLGEKNAPVKVFVFEDFQCPYCGAFSGLNEEMVSYMKERYSDWEPAINNIIKDYVETGKVLLVWKDYPFLGEESHFAAQAARCAQDQDKFWEFHDYLFSHQDGENQGAFSKDNLKEFAGELGLKSDEFNNCLDSEKYKNQVQDAATYGQSVGVSGTPATFIDGKMISGAETYATFKTAIDTALGS